MSDPLDGLDEGLRREVAQASLALAQAEVGRRREVRVWAARGLAYVTEIAEAADARRVWEMLHTLAVEAGSHGDVLLAEIIAAMAKYLAAQQYGQHGIDRLTELGLTLSDVELPPMR